jgi:hypothetical protein
LTLSIFNNQLLGVHRKLIGTKSIPLKHCLDMGFVKADMVIHKPRRRTEENIRVKAQTCSL